MIHFVGDVHGLFQEYSDILSNIPEADLVIQLGDMGIGFGQDSRFPIRNNAFFIRGNHDNPEKCHDIHGYLGDYGYLEPQDLFYVGGAYSVDKSIRTPGFDWWDTEELSCQDCAKAYELYCKTKPKVVVSHDCPYEVIELLYHQAFRTGTNSVLSAMYAAYRPELWVFGHHHRSTQLHDGVTTFQAVNELEVFSFDDKSFLGLDI